jgi:hypothetical protein
MREPNQERFVSSGEESGVGWWEEVIITTSSKKSKR